MKIIRSIKILALLCVTAGAIPSIYAQTNATVEASGQSALPEINRQIERLRASDPATRAAAACALGRMRTRASAAIPFLVELLSDGAEVGETCGHAPPFEDEVWQPDFESVKETTVGEAATQALLAIGEPAHDPLVNALGQSAHWRARKNAAWALAHSGNRSAVRAMIAALRDDAWQVRTQAAYALFQRGGSGAEVVNALITALSDEVWQVRWQAAMSLGHKGGSAVDVTSALLEVLRRDDNPRVRAEAARGLWHMASGSAFPALIAALKDENGEVREALAHTLGNRAGNEEVPLLIRALRDEDARVRRGARQALEIVRDRSRGTTTNLRPLPPGIPD